MVRPAAMSSDVARGWGGRTGKVQSVDQDYLYDYPVMLGSQRVGPDLANYGLRQTNDTLILLHLYNPQLTMPKSVMPPYKYLFERRKLGSGEKPSPDALATNDKADDGYEIVPKEDARALVAYLQSLHSEAVLFEAPPKMMIKTNSAASATNAPAAPQAKTNSPAK
jgi:cytochrome c oxidase cbb3-type subunit 2